VFFFRKEASNPLTGVRVLLYEQQCLAWMRSGSEPIILIASEKGKIPSPQVPTVWAEGDGEVRSQFSVDLSQGKGMLFHMMGCNDCGSFTGSFSLTATPEQAFITIRR
jgi:hypothetical protein